MTVSPAPILLHGAPGSPYTRKMLGVLRYKHLPYRLLSPGQAASQNLPKAPVALLPTFYFADGAGGLKPMVDSTPLIAKLDADHPARPVLIPGPLLALVDALIEDYADEWLTKAMFHYRWHHQADAEKSGTILPIHGDTTAPAAHLAHLTKLFTDRQVGRLSYVGSNTITAPVIEASYARFLDVFNALLADRHFVFGGRPSAADFAIYGQLTQLAHFDPTPMALTLARAPRVFAWVAVMEDLSGLPDTAAILPRDEALAGLPALLAEIGRVYAPALLANANAIASGATEITTEIDGKPWRQNVFPYHVKCLAALRGQFAALPAADQAVFLALAEPAGVAPLFA